MNTRAFGLILTALVAGACIYLVGPSIPYETDDPHQGSVAYWNRSYSKLIGHHHARICDRMPNLRNDVVQVRVNGPDIFKKDPNGTRAGCGNVYFNRYGKGHRTGSGRNFHDWSIH